MASRSAPHGDDISSRTIVLIPARLGSTRLPDKPLAMIAGAPMIVQVWRRAREAAVGPVVVACAEPAIAEAVRAAGGEAVLTDPAPALRHRPDLRRTAGRRPRASLRARGQPAGRSSYPRSRSRSARCSSRSKRSAPTWPRSPTPPRTSTTCATPTWSRPWSASTPIAPSSAGRSTSRAPPRRPAPARSGTISASTPSPATPWSGSRPCRRARSSSASAWSSCAPWRTA